MVLKNDTFDSDVSLKKETRRGQNDTPALNPDPIINVNPSPWFSQTFPNSLLAIYTNTNIQCSSYTTPPPIAPKGGDDAYVSWLEMVSVDNNSTFPETEQWQSAIDFWNAIQNNPGLLDSIAAYVIAQDSLTDTHIPDFAYLDAMMDTFGSDYNAALDSMIGIESATTNQLTFMDSVYNTLTDSTSIANWATIYLELMDTLQRQLTFSTSIIAENHNVHVSVANDLLTRVEALPDSTDYEWNIKTIDGILLQTFAVGVDTLTPTQRSNVEYVANQCPLAGGKAVKIARVMLEINDQKIYDYSDISNCTNQGYYYRTADSNKFNIIVSPNPAATQFSLQYPLAPGQYAKVSLFDIAGNLCFETRMNRSSQSFYLPPMNSGLYFGVLQLSNGTLLHFKISVIQ